MLHLVLRWATCFGRHCTGDDSRPRHDLHHRTFQLDTDTQNGWPTCYAAPNHRAGDRNTEPAEWWACVCRRLQAMEEIHGARQTAPTQQTAPPGLYYYGTWRGRLPTYAHERWWLETRPERRDDYNTWIVFTNWDNYSGQLAEPPREVRWWGVWRRSGDWSGIDYVDRTRNSPWWTVASLTGASRFQRERVCIVTCLHQTMVASRRIKPPALWPGRSMPTVGIGASHAGIRNRHR